ncbi:MAG: hypothetical protein ACP5RS_03900 [Thermoplasmata archaeon]
MIDKQIKAVYRFETHPGEQAQVDFGEYGRIGIDGKIKKSYLFTIILFITTSTINLYFTLGVTSLNSR